MPNSVRHAPPASRAISVLLSLLVLAVPTGLAQSTIPSQLDDREFWNLVTSLSEDDGAFEDENYLSNELGYERTMQRLQESVPPGGVFVGVGPEQNFHYAAALRPAMVFVIDIRRQNAIEHLMYKALFELAEDRADFLSRLFSRPQPSALTADADIGALFASFATIASDRGLFDRTLASIEDALMNRHHWPLDTPDRTALRKVFSAFYDAGPSIMYVFRATTQTHPTYAQMMTARDQAGRTWSFLGSRDAFERVRDMERRNLIVPVVGDFAGPKAMKAVGAYVRSHGARIGAFYASNVETYLFSAGTSKRFYDNLQTLPIPDRAPIIRAFFAAVARDCTAQRPTIRTPVIGDIRALLDAYGSGALKSTCDLVTLSR